jgi:hypothetical protein
MASWSLLPAAYRRNGCTLDARSVHVAALTGQADYAGQRLRPSLSGYDRTHTTREDRSSGDTRWGLPASVDDNLQQRPCSDTARTKDEHLPRASR